MTHEILQHAEHRPWELPRIPWVMYQRWEDLLFASWKVPAERLRPLVPRGLELDEFDGSPWVSLTPFCLASLRLRVLPTPPAASRFLEMNFRTYVRHGTKPGIFFFSLDAASRTAVVAARATYRLPYRHAAMRMWRSDGWIHYESRRTSRSAEFSGRYRPIGPATVPVPGTLDYFLTERYALYAVLTDGIILRGEIHHPPWSLQRAEARIERNTVAAAAGVDLPASSPVFQYAAAQDTLIWPPIPIRT